MKQTKTLQTDVVSKIRDIKKETDGPVIGRKKVIQFKHKNSCIIKTQNIKCKAENLREGNPE